MIDKTMCEVLCCICPHSSLLGLNKIPCLLYEQLFIHTTIWFKRNILLASILSLSYYQRTRCLCKSCVHLSLYISWMHARYADVLDKKVKTLQSTSLYHKLRPNYDNILIDQLKSNIFFY
jgi:hypothetical protein